MSDHCRSHDRYDPHYIECLDAMAAKEESELPPATGSAAAQLKQKISRLETMLELNLGRTNKPLPKKRRNEIQMTLMVLKASLESTTPPNDQALPR